MARRLLKRFETIDDYNDEKYTMEIYTVSHIIEDKSTKYLGEMNKFIATYSATSTTSSTQILGSGFTISQVSKMYIDDVEVTPVAKYTFSTLGEHTVKCIFLYGLTSCYEMFRGCGNLIKLDASELDTSEVTTMNCMFNYCSGLTSLDASNWNTSNVTDMTAVFQYCSGLTSLDVTNWDTSNATTMLGMFRFCCKLTSLDLSSFNTSNVSNMQGMFQHTENIINLDLSNFDFLNVNTVYCFLSSCFYLESVKISNFSNSINVDYMFQNIDTNGTLYYNKTYEDTINSKIVNNSNSHFPSTWTAVSY